MSHINLTEKDNNTTVKAAIDDTIDIILPSNQSTGFLWQAEETTAGHLSMVQQDPMSGLKPGEIGIVRFRFVVTGSGQVDLFCARLWETVSSSAKWFTIMVVV